MTKSWRRTWLPASSTGLVLQAYNQAASLWQQLIQTAYEQAGEVLSTDSYALVQQEQGDWRPVLTQSCKTSVPSMGRTKCPPPRTL